MAMDETVRKIHTLTGMNPQEIKILCADMKRYMRADVTDLEVAEAALGIYDFLLSPEVQ